MGTPPRTPSLSLSLSPWLDHPAAAWTGPGGPQDARVVETAAEVRVATVPRPRPVSTWRRRYLTAAVAIDLLAGLVGSTAGLLRFAPGGGPTPVYVAVSAALPIVWLLSLWLRRAYESRFLFVGNDEYRRVVNAGLWLTVIVVLTSYAVRFELARGYAALSLTLMAGLTLCGRFVLRKRLHHYRAQGRCMHPVLVMGYERTVAGLCRQLARMPQHGMQVVGALLPAERIHPNALHDVHVPVLGGFEDAARAVAESGADTVAVLACPELDGIALRRLAWQLEKSGTDLVVAPALIDAAGTRTTIRPIDGLPMLHVEHPEFTGVRRVAKGAMDRLLAASLILLTAPALLGIALAVRLDSAGGSFFRQVRVGQDGTPFVLHKFRTMRADAEDVLAELVSSNESDGVLFKMRADPRVTRVGRFLRRYSLDELPQLWNVLTGRMSLVGPRPPLPSEVAQYLHDTHRRLAVKPGLTGLWQVSGRSDLSWEESVRLDLRYVENWSLTSDLLILARTVRAVVRSSGAY